MALYPLLTLSLLVPTSAQPNFIPEKYLDCGVRRAAFSYALSLFPSRNNRDVHDSLQLAAYCGDPLPPSTLPSPPLPLLSGATPSFYCDSKLGSDTSGDGSQASPFASIQRGVGACRSVGGGGCSVVLRDSAPFYLSAPLSLDGRDSGLTITAFPGEAPVVSGGTPLEGLEWVRVPSALPGANIWKAHAPLPAIPGALLVSGKRQPRARWPNSDADSDTVPTGWSNASSWLPRPPSPPPVVVPGNYSRPEDHFFPNFVWAVNGSALGQFEPPEGYWVAPTPEKGGPTYAIPGAFLFNAPHFSPRVGTWTNPTSAVVHTFHGGYWGSWQFYVAGVQAPQTNASGDGGGVGQIDLGEGGWQEARGWPSGGALYVENVLEELDSPAEWYYNQASGDLTFWYNSTQGTPPPTTIGEGGVPVASQVEVLINATGSPTSPIVNLTLAGITFTGTQPTFLSHRFRAPSGGDWSFSEVAALTLTHTVGGSISGCTFTTLGGNGVLVSGANQGARVEGCTFSRLGENGVVACGERGILQDLRGKGVPVGTTLINNVFSELGVFVKQSGAFYAALAANSTISRNVAFNLPRAAVNINDGAFGGHLIEGNLFFQTVRESADHAPINTWDREPYLLGFKPSSTSPSDTALTPILYGSTSRCTANFLVCDGYAIHCLDHDDGSNAWEDQGNVIAWAGIKNYLGFNKSSINNLIVRPDYNLERTPGMHPGTGAGGVPLPAGFYFPACLRTLGQWSWGPTLADSYLNNTCILGGGGNGSSSFTTNPYIFGAGTCQPSAPASSGALPRAAGNTYYAHNAQVAIACGKVNLTLEEAAAVGWEVGSSAVSNSAFTNDAQGAAALEALIHGFLGF